VLQIRLLIQERNELQKRVDLKDEELSKIESRLQAVLKERTSLAANVASLERDLGDLRKANDTLKTKVINKIVPGSDQLVQIK
jgi:hyaluronan-mediated motility receptor